MYADRLGVSFMKTKFDTSTLTEYYLHKNNYTCTLRNVCTLKRQLALFIPTEI